MTATQAVPDAYLEVRVDVPRELVDAACDFIIENLASGIVLEEEEDAPQTGIIFYVPEGDCDYQSRLSEFLSNQDSSVLPGLPEVRQRRVENSEWLEKYRQSVKPLRISDDLIVRPTWIAPTGDRYQIIVDPKMAFGTGNHATTRACLKIIRRQFGSGMRFLDMGCGSGVLSVLADQMGAAYIKAVDYDLAAVANCRENFDINQVRRPHNIVIGSIEQCTEDDVYEFVCANIICSTILTMLRRLLAATKTGGLLVLSGLLTTDESAVSEALSGAGQAEFTISRDDEWSTFVIRKR